MFCPNCGTRVGQDVNVCQTCGTNMAEHRSQLPPPPPPPPPGSAMVQTGPRGMTPPPGVSDKSRIAAGLLEILLGPFGAGRFYTGHYGLAVGQIAAVGLTGGLGGAGPIIDGLLMLAGKINDAEGRPLRD